MGDLVRGAEVRLEEERAGGGRCPSAVSHLAGLCADCFKQLDTHLWRLLAKCTCLLHGSTDVCMPDGSVPKHQHKARIATHLTDYSAATGKSNNTSTLDRSLSNCLPYTTSAAATTHCTTSLAPSLSSPFCPAHHSCPAQTRFRDL